MVIGGRKRRARARKHVEGAGTHVVLLQEGVVERLKTEEEEKRHRRVVRVSLRNLRAQVVSKAGSSLRFAVLV